MHFHDLHQYTHKHNSFLFVLWLVYPDTHVAIGNSDSRVLVLGHVNVCEVEGMALCHSGIEGVRVGTYQGIPYHTRYLYQESQDGTASCSLQRL